ncbi:hypothetical protein MKW94_008438 [Papaver nudicaule]|uniref:Uncharacterized protein n=1 Tax=Papaver nudicaule TaxID=74823 RepID=A0AA41VT18_PAPNU|nr:hypothetical protein [Papaver nudicaule]
MARGANMMGLAMLLVVVMAVYVGQAEGTWYTGICSIDCAQDKNPHGVGEAAAAFAQCMAECLHYSGFKPQVKPSPKMQKAFELFAQAPEKQQDIPISLGRKAFSPSLSK